MVRIWRKSAAVEITQFAEGDSSASIGEAFKRRPAATTSALPATEFLQEMISYRPLSRLEFLFAQLENGLVRSVAVRDQVATEVG